MNNIVSGVFCFDDDGSIVELVGGYDEWEKYRAQKRAESVPKPDSAKPQPARQKTRSKLTNKEREELEKIPEAIERLEAEAAQISENLADSQFVINNADKLAEINARLEEIKAEDERLMERWEQLETLRNELEKK